MFPPIATDLPEHGIWMLKPDAHARGLAGAIEARVRGVGEIVARTGLVRLSELDVRRYFLHALPPYVDALTAGPVEAWLVRASDVHERLYALKHELRAALGVDDRARNLVHAADPGPEYHRLLARFFPELDPRRYASPVDLDLRVDGETSRDRWTEILRSIDDRPRQLSLTLGPAAAHLASLRSERWRHLSLACAVRVAVPDAPGGLAFLVHLHPDDGPARVHELGALSDVEALRQWLAAHPRPVTAQGLEPSSSTLERYATAVARDPDAADEALATAPELALAEAARAIGASWLSCLEPHRSLMSTELVCDLARIVGLRAGGGSAGAAAPGGFGIPAHGLRGSDLEVRA